MRKIIRYYLTPNGKAPFVIWLKKIKDHIIRSRIEQRIERMERGNFGDCKTLGDGINELRLDFGPGYRIYFAEQDEIVIILFCGGDKSGQTKDILAAKQYWQELKERTL